MNPIVIPIVAADQFDTNTAGQEQLVQMLRRWSLFGTVVLNSIDKLDLEVLESIITQVGGSVDLWIEFEQPTEEPVLALLNAGATAVLCKPEQVEALAAVPSDRIISHPPNHTKYFQLLDSQPGWIVDQLAEKLTSDRPDGLWPTIIVDPLGQALGLAYSNRESLLDAITHRRGTYWSRSRNGLWIKGATSGATQQLLGIRLDCDGDCLRFQVTQDPPGFCHKNTHTCFGAQRSIEAVIQRLTERIESADEKSFTRRLINDSEMLQKKMLEEARELATANSLDEIAWEAADVFYFSLVKMIGSGVKLEQVYYELARRMNRVVRRPPGLKE